MRESSYGLESLISLYYLISSIEMIKSKLTLGRSIEILSGWESIKKIEDEEAPHSNINGQHKRINKWRLKHHSSELQNQLSQNNEKIINPRRSNKQNQTQSKHSLKERIKIIDYDLERWEHPAQQVIKKQRAKALSQAYACIKTQKEQIGQKKINKSKEKIRCLSGISVNRKSTNLFTGIHKNKQNIRNTLYQIMLNKDFFNRKTKSSQRERESKVIISQLEKSKINYFIQYLAKKM